MRQDARGTKPASRTNTFWRLRSPNVYYSYGYFGVVGTTGDACYNFYAKSKFGILPFFVFSMNA